MKFLWDEKTVGYIVISSQGMHRKNGMLNCVLYSFIYLTGIHAVVFDN